MRTLIEAYSLTADIRVPHFGLEFHAWRTERIVGGNGDEDAEGSAFIWGPRRPRERSPELRDIIMVSDRLNSDLGMDISLDIGKLFTHTSHPIACHIGSMEHQRKFQ